MRSTCIRFAALFLLLLLPAAAHAATTLTVAPIAWNVIGLDSNDPATGPANFPIGARVCSSAATTNVAVTFVWDSANPLVDLRAGSLGTVNIPAISAGQCSDAYFEVSIVRVPAAFDTTRRYHITATDVSGTASTVTPREVYVEHLISQNRNSITDVKYGTNLGNLVSVPDGGSMNLVVGNTYVIQLLGGTATQGYNQFEAFINFPNTIFQVLGVTTSYSADNSPFVPNPNDKLYADACLWENDPNSPNYRSCVGGDFKAGGSNVVTTYTIKIIGGGGTSQTLNTLLYDFSGSSYHYNADFSTGARVANVIDPTASTIAKSFSPNPTSLNGISVLTITLHNPNTGTVSGYNFVDNLPANLVVAATPAANTSGCGAPTLTATAGSSSISFSNGTLAANSNCVINVNVTPTATGSLVNTTNHLFIDAVDTGHNAAATLTVNNAPPPPPPLCGLTLASWTVPDGTVANPPDLAGGLPTTKAANVATATLAANVPGSAAIIATGGHGDATSWRTNGYKNAGQFVQFTIDTTNYTAVQMSFWVSNPSPSNGPTAYNLTINNGGGFGAPIVLTVPPIAFTHYTIDATGLTNPSGNTIFKLTATGANNDATGASLNYDDMSFTGCSAAVQPTIAKAFSPSPVTVNGISTLTFTLTNTNLAPLTGAAFTDSLPTGVQVAPTPSASTTCGGPPTWAPAPAATSLTFSGGTIPANGSCTVSVNVQATTAGPHGNVSGTLSTTQTGTNPSSIGTANLTAVLPPGIAKQFDPSPILAGGVSTLTFVITNPNQNNTISGVAFADTFPTSPGAMTVAGTPAASTTGCGAPVFNPVAGAGSISFTGGTIVGGGTCVVTVNVTAPVVGTYNNTSGNVSHIINAVPVNGNTASGALSVVPPNPAISLGKQISLNAGGPWSTFIPVTTGPVFYRFTVENTGDVPLNPISITDDTLDVSGCNATFASITLPVAVAGNDNHIVTCVVGPVSIAPGSHTNTAHATGTFAGVPHNSPNDSATYATTGLTLDKTSVESTYLAAGNLIHYNYLVTNSGFATLQGPVTVADNKATVTCPAVSTVGDLDNFLDPGESITCSATYTITPADVANASVTNTATATVQGVNSNSDSTTVFLATSADVLIVKTLTTAGPFTAGQSITYTLFVKNNGPSTATNIQVTDTPTNLSITGVSGGGCAALPCTIPTLASGANTTITVTATITAPGAFDNSATVSATEPDPVPGNNTDNTGNGGLTGASADMSVIKTLVTAGPFTIGQSVSYTLFVENHGPSTATNVQVTDTPSNLSITSVSGGGCAALPCTIASLASNANVTISVTATITAAGSFNNTATVSATEPDPVSTNNTSNDGGTAAASADVRVVKTLTTSGPFTDGQSITFTLFVENLGPSTATSIQVTDTPANLNITNVSGGGCAALPCTIASLALNANVTITVTATITAPGSFNNTANVSATEPDPNVNNNTDSAGGTAAASADVLIDKTLVTSGPFSAGQTISYTLFVKNNGPSTATTIQVTDTPTNLTITNVSGGGCAALPCTIASLALNANVTITVTATITAAGAFSNAATVSATEPDPVPGNNTDNAGGTAAAAADVRIVKTLTTSAPYFAGQSISYTLFVENLGPSAATNVQVTDTPTNMTITNVSGGGCAALPCTIASLGVGANATITVTAKINSAAAFSNTATVSATETDPIPGNNSDSKGGTATSSADVRVVKTLVTSSPYFAGQSISYTLFVENLGPSTATSVQVTDTPSNLSITNVSGGGCASLPCTIATLASGANVTISVTATITAAGAFDNTATVTATEPDPNTNNNTDSIANGGTASPSADVSIDKTLTTVGPYSAGQSVTYTLFISNSGPSTATSIQVTDTPTNLTITNVSGGGCAALPCTIASLGVGANVTITVTATINPGASFDNSATVTAAEFDPNTTNNTDSTNNGALVGVSANIAVSKTLTTAGPFTIGQSVNYTLLVSNAGPSTATNIQVTDTPTNLTITTVTGACTALPCTIASLASGANTTISVTATITGSAFNNSATVAAAEPDPNTNNNTSSAGGTATASANVSMVKTLTTAGPFTAGQTVSYTLVVGNAGPSTATNVQVTDTPTHLTITTVTGGCTALPCTIASLASGSSVTINVTATITAAGSFDNSATASATEPDPNPGNNTDNSGNGGVAGAASVDVGIVKTAPPTPAVGVPFDYTLVVTNHGPITATGVTVSDPLPANFALVSATSTQGSCSGTTTVTCNVGTMLNGASVTITIRGTPAVAGPMSNTATVASNEPDSQLSNNTSTASVNVVEDVPALSTYGLMLLALALAFTAAFAARIRG